MMTSLPLMGDAPDDLLRWFCDEGNRLAAMTNNDDDRIDYAAMAPEDRELIGHILANFRDAIRRFDQARSGRPT